MDTVKLLKKMMAFKSVSADVGQVNKQVDFMAAYMKQAGLYVKIEKMGQRKILFAATRRTKSPVLLMNSHLDVLPAPDNMFKITRKGGWLYGRGTNDCLGNSAVIAQAMIAVGQRADVGAVFSTDEEIGGATAEHMVRLGYRGKRMVLIMDGTGNAVAKAQKGILAVRMRARGKASHSSQPWQGENAIDRLITGYLKIKREFLPVHAGDEWHNTLSANIMQAGTVFNRVPDLAEMVLDIRYTEKTRSADLLKKLRRLSGLDFDVVTESPVVFTDEKAPALRALRDFMQNELNRKIPFVRMNGATDARHFRRLKIPCAIIGIPGTGAHTMDERVHADDMRKYEEMLKRYFVIF